MKFLYASFVTGTSEEIKHFVKDSDGSLYAATPVNIRHIFKYL